MAQTSSGAPHFYTQPGACSGALAHVHFTMAHLGVKTPFRAGGAGVLSNCNYTFEEEKCSIGEMANLSFMQIMQS